MKPIATDSQSFEAMRQQGCLYVDKTDFVWRLVSSSTRSFFLSRPRRFGKSMILSTLEAYFQGKKELFKGLKIESLAPQEWEQWPVVHLDMSKQVSRYGVEQMNRGIVNQLQNVAQSLNVPLRQDNPDIMFENLLVNLHNLTGKQVVVLIDEYDKPILDTLNTPYSEEVLKAVHDFYIVLKNCNSLLRFVFVTGVSKFAHTSLFSGMNNLQDITQEDTYATMLGYTKQELLENFPDHIAAAAEKHMVAEDELVERMKDWYDGFRFVPGSETLFNPVSIGKFFGEYKFSNYWYETGTPTFLVEQLKNNPFNMEEFTENWYEMDDAATAEVFSLDPLSLAIQTGYLTIKEWQEDEGSMLCRYDFPNREIRQSWSKRMLPLLFQCHHPLQRNQLTLRTAIGQGDTDTLMQCLQQLIAGLSYENIGQLREGDYRNLLKIAFTSMGYHANVEDHNIRGRVDLAVLTRERAYVFELKLQRTPGKEEELLAEAIRQAQESHYADKYKFDHKHVHTLAVVFDDNSHQLVAWKEI